MSDTVVSVVTPCLDSADLLVDTIRSIKRQSHPRVEHVVVDGGSSDGTMRKLRRHEDDYDLRWVSEPDEGVYDAIETGFEMATGDVYCWLNAGDIHYPWTAEVVASELSTGTTDWVTGHPSWADRAGTVERVAAIRPYYRRNWLLRGWYNGRDLGYVQQEGCFWTRTLWETAGGFPDEVEVAGDYWLWRQFATVTDLRTVPVPLAAFRDHEDQLSDDVQRYRSEVETSSSRLVRHLPIHELYSLSVLGATKLRRGLRSLVPSVDPPRP